jgi:hypothetical protein
VAVCYTLPHRFAPVLRHALRGVPGGSCPKGVNPMGLAHCCNKFNSTINGKPPSVIDDGFPFISFSVASTFLRHFYILAIISSTKKNIASKGNCYNFLTSPGVLAYEGVPRVGLLPHKLSPCSCRSYGYYFNQYFKVISFTIFT